MIREQNKLSMEVLSSIFNMIEKKDKMNQPRNSSSGDNHQNREPFSETVREQSNSDQSTQLPVMEVSSECEPAASRVGINDLPDELLVRILSYSTFKKLTNVMQNVCSRWRRLSHDRSLWRNKKFCINSKYSDYKAMALMKKMPQLRTLEVQRVVRLAVIDTACDYCRRLTTLKLDPAQEMDISLLQKLVRKCANIASLAISHHVLQDQNMAQTLAQLRHLRSLDITANFRIVHLRPFADRCPKLARLKMSKMFNISVEDMEYFFNRKCRALTHLTLPWITFNGRCIVTLLKDCTSLCYLELNDCTVVAYEAPEAFLLLRRLPNLRVLILNDLQRCPPEAPPLAFESGGLPRLQVLRITNSSIVDSVLKSVCMHCPGLKALHLSRCRELSNETLGQLHRLGNLESLNLGGCEYLRENAIQCIAQLPKLRKLFLTALCETRDLNRELRSILDITPLEVLSLHCRRWMTVFPFERIPRKLINLRVLKVKGAPVNILLVNYLRNRMPRLRVKFE